LPEEALKKEKRKRSSQNVSVKKQSTRRLCWEAVLAHNKKSEEVVPVHTGGKRGNQSNNQYEKNLGNEIAQTNQAKDTKVTRKKKQTFGGGPRGRRKGLVGRRDWTARGRKSTRAATWSKAVVKGNRRAFVKKSLGGGWLVREKRGRTTPMENGEDKKNQKDTTRS